MPEAAMPQRVLVIDDDARVLRTLARHLRLRDYEVVTAADGARGLDLFFAERPDLVLLDVRMPHPDGFAVLDAIRQESPEADVVFITGHSDMAVAIEALRAGASDFIVKPVDVPALEAALARASRRLRLKRAVQAERARFEWAVAQAQDGYLMLDAAGHAHYANPRARSYLALPQEGTLPAIPFVELARRHYYAQPRAAWDTWPAPLDPEAASPRYLLRPESETAQAIWLQVDLIEMPGHGESYLVRLRDVTATIISQNVIWSVDTLISYKLRNPLGQLMGFLNLLQHDLPQLTQDEMRGDLAEARRGAQELHATILDVLRYLEALDITQAEGGTCRLERLIDLLSDIQADLGLKAVVVQVEGLDVQRARVPLSERATELVLWELCENAQKFHPQHAPALRIRARPAPGGGLVLQVRDDGQHLAPEQLSRIWLPYYQGEKHFTGEVPGLGLGLPTVASLVWSVGGVCRAYNREDGPGLVVELVLPESPS